MGADITTRAQKKMDDGKFETVKGNFSSGSSPFNWRSYGIFGFLADVRNYSAITPIAKERGAPEDWPKPKVGPLDWDSESPDSWLSVDELVNYDYDQIIEDRRIDRHAPSDDYTCEPGKGKKESLREFLGEAFFNDLKELQNIGADRILMWFSS